MPYVDSKEPLESKLNWLGILTAAVAALTGLLNSEWVATNPKLTMIITAVVGVLTVVIRTFFTHGPTTLTKAVIVFALAIGAASTASAAPTSCVRGPDGVVRCGQQSGGATFKKLPWPTSRVALIRKLFGR